MKKSFLPIFFCSLMLLASCGDNSSSAGAAANSSKASQIMDKTSNALESTGGSLSAFAPLMASPRAIDPDDCSPSSSGGASVQADLFPSIVCLFETNSKSPDTFIGALHLINEIMSKSEKVIAYQYLSTPTIHNNVTVTLDVNDPQKTYNVSVRESAVTGGDWNYKIEISFNSTFDANDVEVVVFLKEGTTIGAKIINYDSGSFTGALEILVDTTSGILRYENWDISNSRHTRVYVAGSINSSGEVENLTSVAFAHADESISVSAGSGTANKGALVAISDGTNVKFDFHAQNNSSTLYSGVCAEGVCGGLTVPTYGAAFATPNASGLENYIKNSTGGLLAFTPASFGLTSYFIP